ncbi:TlpA disulfide reductase family protein [Wenyingzhuangia sp. chi5]|uniref:TlpA disulfide reductase family protein n=1 Tax=Wenyingzhuangia gilva TaxID=3057677 RepID=A0ABT8VVQ1_9FLAO|nr:TlpA disulfide reductase family protein [Wenyingzhuangia sp. chi5]MDO3696053.1 TlpA disulfide reductase family protein [Wenyingzhuangia sp. chi5]
MKNQNYLTVLLFALILSCCKNEKKFNIIGTISPVQDSIIKLEYTEKDSTYILENKIENGKFSFKGNINDITFGSILYKQGTPAHFLIEPGTKTEVSIQGRLSKIISSSNLSNLYNEYSSTRNQKTKDSIIKVFSENFIEHDFYAEMVLGWLSMTNPEITAQKEIKKQFLESNNQSKKLEIIMSYFERNETTEVGKFIPNLIFPNTLNQPTPIIDSKNKYTLIDFWATWCYPCKRNNEYLKKYKDLLANQGIKITNVSIEEDFETWKKGSLIGGISWTNVIDTSGISTNTLKFEQIPFTILVNQKGKIILSNMKYMDIEKLAIRGIID